MAAVYKAKLAEEAARLKAEEEDLERLRASYVPPTEEELRQKAEEAIVAIKAQEEARVAAYPTEFAEALAAYMAYLRPLVKEAIQEAVESVSRYDVNTPQTALQVSMDSFRCERGAGCCDLDGGPAHLQWEKKDGLNHFDARDFFNKPTYSYEEMGLKGPVDQMKAELEPLGYKVMESYDGFYIEVPLA